MDGILNILKPPGMTSHDVVAWARRLLKTRQIGHTGTLDPAAAGVLPLCAGLATRIVPYLLDADKSYRAEMILGVSTDTQDAAGRTIAIETDFAIPPARLGDAMARFVGRIQQVPPMASAVRYKGERLYEMARRGEEVERPPRTVTVHRLAVRRVTPDDPYALGFGTRVLFDVDCSKGTYVRTLVHDLGRHLGCGAHLAFLLRTRVGAFSLEDSLTLEEAAEAAAAGGLPLLPLDAALGHLPAIYVGPEGARRARHGAILLARHLTDRTRGAGDLVRVYGPGQELLCIARVQNAAGERTYRPVRLLCAAD